MKKSLAFACLFLFTTSLCEDKIQIDCELTLEEEIEEEELIPSNISINISVTNTNDVDSKNKTTVSQKEITIESAKDNQPNFLIRYVKAAFGVFRISSFFKK